MNFQEQTKIILASSSPRRKQLLETLDLKFTIQNPKIEERQRENELPKNYAIRNANEKGLAIGATCFQTDLVISADTIVVTQNNQVLEKPIHAQNAFEMLSLLSNTTHFVYTAYSFVQDQKIIISKLIETQVTFRKLFEKEIRSYIQTGDPFDKSGSYGIQGPAMSFVDKIQGSFTNVMGLPLSHIYLDLVLLKICY